MFIEKRTFRAFSCSATNSRFDWLICQQNCFSVRHVFKIVQVIFLFIYLSLKTSKLVSFRTKWVPNYRRGLRSWSFWPYTTSRKRTGLPHRRSFSSYPTSTRWSPRRSSPTYRGPCAGDLTSGSCRTARGCTGCRTCLRAPKNRSWPKRSRGRDVSVPKLTRSRPMTSRPNPRKSPVAPVAGNGNSRLAAANVDVRTGLAPRRIKNISI